MGDDPDPSNDESSGDETQPPTDEEPSATTGTDPSDSDEPVENDGVDDEAPVESDDPDSAADEAAGKGEAADDVADGTAAGSDGTAAGSDDTADGSDSVEDGSDDTADADDFPDAEEVKNNVYGGGADDEDSLWDTEADDPADADTDADDPSETDTDENGENGETSENDDPDEPTFEEQLEEARETNPPLDRDEVEEDPAMVPDADPYGMNDDGDGDGDGGETDDAGAADSFGDENDEEFFEGPESDEEMPLAVHIEEMMKRLGVVFLFAGVATAIAFPYASEMINYLWSYHIPAPIENRPRLYGPLELVLTRLKVAGILGVIVGLPVFVYESYLFMRPGLYRTERRYYLAAVPTSLVLGAIGMLFAHFLVLPAIFAYFTSYTTGVAIVAYGLAETFNLIVMLISFMAIVFQIPLFIMLAIMMGLVTREWLEDKRLVFWGTFFGIAFIFSPDPTGMAPIIVTLTMIGLYEGTLALLRWTGN